MRQKYIYRICISCFPPTVDWDLKVHSSVYSNYKVWFYFFLMKTSVVPDEVISGFILFLPLPPLLLQLISLQLRPHAKTLSTTQVFMEATIALSPWSFLKPYQILCRAKFSTWGYDISCIPVMGIYSSDGAFIYRSMVQGFVRRKFNIRVNVSKIMLIYLQWPVSIYISGQVLG